MEPLKDSIILAKTHPPMYLIHKYWARKPYNVVRSYIQKYTQPGEVVLDPFCGSGVTVAESVLKNRKAIGIDINPFSIFLTQTTLTPVDISSLKELFNKIIEQVHSQIAPYFEIICPFCGKEAIIAKIIWRNLEPNHQLPPKEKIQEIRINCNFCGKKNVQLDPVIHQHCYTQEEYRVRDINTHFTEELHKNQVEIPNISLKYQNGVKFRQIRHYLIENPNAESLFTKRNLLVLGLIRKAINTLIPVHTSETRLIELRNLLLLTFTASIGQASKMVWVISKRKSNFQKKKEVGSWTHHFFWNPTEFFENNPLLGFITRSKKTIRAQINLQSRLSKNTKDTIIWAKSWSEFEHLKSNIFLHNSSSKKIPIPDQNIDYIFTDPPYGDSIQYFELSSLWNAWLNISSFDHEKNEIIINPRQEKTKHHYFHELTAVFTECYRVLKNNRYMTITFHNTDGEIRNGLIESVRNAGFLLESLVFQMPPRNSLKSYLHYKNTPIGDYFLRFKKSPSMKISENIMSSSTLKHVIQTLIEEILIHRGEPTPLFILFNCIDENLANRGAFPLHDPLVVQNTINEMKESNYITVNQKNYMWFTPPERQSEQDLILTNRILDFLKNHPPNLKDTESDIYNKVYEKFNGWDTPDRRDLMRIIKENKKIG